MAIAVQLPEITEGSTPFLTGTIKDEQGVVVSAASLTAVRLTFYSELSGQPVNGRLNQNVLNANNVTIGGAGEITWKLLEADTLLIENPKPAVGFHCAVFVFEWFDAQGDPRQFTQDVIFPIRRVRHAPFAP